MAVIERDHYPNNALNKLDAALNDIEKLKRTASTAGITTSDVSALIAAHAADAEAHHATIPDASETVKGIAELATTGEAQTGTATTLIVTPAGLRADVPATPAASRGVRLDASGNLVFTTGNLGVGTTSPGFFTTPFRGVEILYDGDGFPNIRLQRTNGITKTDGIWDIYLGSTGALAFRDTTNSRVPMVFDENGRMGVGQTAITAQLEIKTFATATPTLKLSTLSSQTADLLQWTTGALGVNGNMMIGTTTDGMTTGGSLAIAKDLAHRGTKVGFYNTAPAAKPTVTGSRGGNAALASLLTALAGLGLLTDSSS